MNATMISWALGGVLTASLGWNYLQQAQRDEELRAIRSLATSRRPCEFAEQGCQQDPCNESAVPCCTSESLEGLGIPADRWDSIRRRCAACTESLVDLREQMASVRERLSEELAAKALNEEVVQALTDELGKLRAAEVTQAVNVMIDLRELLTAEQVTRLWECCAESFPASP